MNPHFEKVGQEFVTAYYGMFDSNRATLAALYVSFSLFCLNIDRVEAYCELKSQAYFLFAMP